MIQEPGNFVSHFETKTNLILKRKPIKLKNYSGFDLDCPLEKNQAPSVPAEIAISLSLSPHSNRLSPPSMLPTSSPPHSPDINPIIHISTSTCPWCILNYTPVKRKKITCTFCAYSACIACRQRNILQRLSQGIFKQECAHCHEPETWFTILLIFPHRWIQRVYIPKLQACLFKRDLSVNFDRFLQQHEEIGSIEERVYGYVYTEDIDSDTKLLLRRKLARMQSAEAQGMVSEMDIPRLEAGKKNDDAKSLAREANVDTCCPGCRAPISIEPGGCEMFFCPQCYCRFNIDNSTFDTDPVAEFENRHLTEFIDKRFEQLDFEDICGHHFPRSNNRHLDLMQDLCGALKDLCLHNIGIGRSEAAHHRLQFRLHEISEARYKDLLLMMYLDSEFTAEFTKALQHLIENLGFLLHHLHSAAGATQSRSSHRPPKRQKTSTSFLHPSKKDIYELIHRFNNTSLYLASRSHQHDYLHISLNFRKQILIYSIYRSPVVNPEFLCF